MRFGLLSDIHANLPALRAVLERLSIQGVDGYLCAGDFVGYGPFPNECVEAVAELSAVCVTGNHDLMAVQALPEDQAGALARQTLAWTRTVLNADSLAFLRALPVTATVGNLLMGHGSLDDPQEYVRSPGRADELMDMAVERLPELQALILGHTHRPWAYGRRSGTKVRRAPARARLRADETYLINPGSVGQSRDRSPLARYALIDLSGRSVTYHAVEYDRSGLRSALVAAGLPPTTDHYPPSLAARRHELTDALRDRLRPRLRPTPPHRRV